MLIVGLGGLGSPAALYLAAAGVGRIGLADYDTVSLSNLQRQILYTEQEIGESKVKCARNRLSKLTSRTIFEEYPEGITDKNAITLISQYDLVIDCTDNIGTRRLLDKTCSKLGKPWVHGAIAGFYGHVTVFNYLSKRHYEDLFPESDSIPDMKDEIIGTMGVLPGIIGSLQAAEALKIVTGIGEVLDGRLFTINILDNSTQIFDL